MSAVNEAIQLPDTGLMRIVSLKEGQIFPPPNSENLPCDASHLAGYSSSDVDSTEMMSLIKRELPKIDFPVRVGSTGYIIWPDKSVLPKYGYTLDEIGRTVGVVDEIRFFQRYTGNCMLVASMGRKDDHFTTLTQEDKDTLRNKVCLVGRKNDIK